MRFGWKNPEIGRRVTTLRQRLGGPRIRRELMFRHPYQIVGRQKWLWGGRGEQRAGVGLESEPQGQKVSRGEAANEP